MLQADMLKINIIKQALAQEAAFDLLRELVRMIERGQFEPSARMAELLKKYPEASEAYQKLVTETRNLGLPQRDKTGNELLTGGKRKIDKSDPNLQEPPDADKRTTLDAGLYEAEDQDGEKNNIFTKSNIVNTSNPNIEEAVLSVEQPPTADPEAYATPQQFRHPSAIYCELGHTYYGHGKRYLDLSRRDLAWARFARAVQAYRAAIQEHSTSSELRHYLADALAQQQKFEEALKIILEAVPLDFHNSDEALEKAHGWLNEDSARSLRDLEREWSPGIENESLDNETRAHLFGFLARVRYYQADYVQAADHYEQALQRDADNYFALEGLAACLWQLNERARAVDVLHQAIEQADLAQHIERQEKNRQRLIEMLIEMRSYEEALSIIQDGLKLNGPRHAFFPIAKGRVYLLQKRYHESVEICLEALKQDESQVDAHLILAEAYSQLKNYTGAIAAADKALVLKPNHLIALKIKAEALLEEGRELDQAARLLQIYLQRNPEDGEAQYFWIKSLRLQGQPAMEVMSSIKRALQIVPGIDQVPLLLELVQAYLKEDKSDEAMEQINKIFQLQPDIKSALLLQLHGDACNQFGQTDSAMIYYKKGLELEPDNLQILQRLAEMQTAAQQFQEAIQYWERYLQTTPQDVQAWIALAQAHFHQESWEKSLEAINRSFEQTLSEEQQIVVYQLKGDVLTKMRGDSKEIADAYYQAARRLVWRGQYDEANNLCRSVLQIDQHYIHAYWSLADNLRLLSYEPSHENLIHESLNAWEAGATIRLPQQEDSWSYLARALICERLSEGQKVTLKEQQLFSWEALTFVERELLLSDWDEYGWAYLGRFYRNLGQESAALTATKKAMELNQENLNVLQEWAPILANTGQFEEADKVISQVLEKSPLDSWAQGVKAYVLHHLGKFQQALELIEKVLETKPDDIWSLDFQADCQRALAHYNKLPTAQPEIQEQALASYRDHWQKAREIYVRIWEKYKNKSQDINASNLDTVGWAAYQIGEFREAQAIFEDMVEELDEGDANWSNLGLTLIAQGQKDHGMDILFMEIARAKNARKLNDFVNMDLLDVKNGYVIWPYSSDEIGAILAEINEKVSDQLKTIAEPVSPIDELKEKIDQETKENRVGSCWFAAQAGLARLYATENRWAEAAKAYHSLFVESDHSKETLKPFPEARIGLERAVESLYSEVTKAEEVDDLTHALEVCKQILPYEQALGKQDKVGDLHLRMGDIYCLSSMQAEALKHYDQADKSEAIAGEPIKSADLQSRYAFAQFLAGKTGKLRKYYQQATYRYRLADLPNPGGRFAEVCQSLIRSKELFWKLEQAIRRWNTELKTGEILRADLLATQQALVGYLDNLYKLPVGSPDDPLIPFVTPIVVEFADDIVPKVDDKQDGGQFLFKDVPAMRERIQKDTGVTVTGLRARSNPSLAPGGYVIQLDEIPVANGSAQTNMGYCPASLETLQSLGIDTQGSIPGSHPGTGEVGSWMPQEQWSQITAQGLELWPETRYMIVHIETILRRNLTNFLNMQDVETILEEWAKNEQRSSLIKVAIPDQDSRVRFARLLRMLVREWVPITNADEILSAIHDEALSPDRLADTLRSIRLGLKQQLPVNKPGEQYLDLPSEIEDTLISWRKPENGKNFFAAPPNELRQLLSSLQKWLRPLPANIVLITRSSEIRLYLRRLIEFQFPDLMVISREEQLVRSELPTISKATGQTSTTGANLYAA